MNKKYAQVIVDNKASSTDKPYTYIIKPDLVNIIEEGMRVLVPFGMGNRVIKGIVIKIENHYEKDYKLKSIIDVIDDKPLISKDMIELSLWMSKYYLSPYLEAFQTVLPPGNFKEVKTYVSLKGNNYVLFKENLSSLENDILNLLINEKSKIELEKYKRYIQK